MTQIRWAFDFSKWRPTRDEWIWANRCIQPEERVRIARFVFQKDAKASMVGRLLMRKFVAQHLKADYTNLRFARTDKGKPFLSQPDGIKSSVSFNLSHNGNFCVMASNGDHPIGVDVMKAEYSGGKSVDEFFRLMFRQFAPKEWETIKSPATNGDRLRLFFRHWCLKESYVKAIGTGIGFDLQRLCFKLGSKTPSVTHVTTDTVLFVDGHPDGGWKFEECLLDDMHLVATAVKVHGDDDDGSIPAPAFQILTTQEVFQDSIAWNEPEEDLWVQFESKQDSPF